MILPTIPVDQTVSSMVCQPSPEPRLWLEVDYSGNSAQVGEQIPLRVCVSRLPDGLAGFDITLSSRNNGGVEFVNVDLPQYGLQSFSPLPDQTVRLRAVDLGNIVPPGAENILLATAYLSAKSPGQTDLMLSVTALDDDQGFPITPKIMQTSLEVVPN